MPFPPPEDRFLRFLCSLGAEEFIAIKATGSEALGQLFEVEVELASQSHEVELNDLLGTNAALEIRLAGPHFRTASEHSRFLHGVISRCSHVGFHEEGWSRYRVTLVPWLWFLTRTSDCRIFQRKTVREIIETLFRDAGCSDYRFDLRREQRLFRFTVQYQETDFNFVSRLMEREGMYYFVEHTEERHTIVICDHMEAHQPGEHYERLMFLGGDTTAEQEALVTRWELSREVKPGKLTLNDFDFAEPVPSPNSRLLTRSSIRRDHARSEFEIYDHPGGYHKLPDGDPYARLRIEEIHCDHETIEADTTVHGLSVGNLFEFANYPREDQNRDYLVTHVKWEAQEGAYSARDGASSDPFFRSTIRGIPTTGTYRPARVTPLPQIVGPQTAIVVGDPGVEIHVDDEARIKVQFIWDRYGKSNDGSSCWIRVSQPWAGTGFGGLAIPRVGQEVIVEFLEGDPDRPIITGRVYNGANPPIVTNAGREDNPARAARENAKKKAAKKKQAKGA